MLKSMLAGFSVVLTLAACGPSTPPPAASPAQGEAASSGVVAPNAPAPGGPATTAAQTPAPLPTAEPGVFRVGNFAARIEGAVLNRRNATAEDGRLSFTLSFINTGSDPMSVVPMNANWEGTSALLDIGAKMTVNGGAMGMPECGLREAAECRQQDAAKYTQIDPGGSFTTNVVLFGYFTPDQLTALPQVKSATYSMRLHLIQGSSIDRPVQVSITGVPVRVIG